eukprot:7954473-Alexandrium_andersonii.AAC.1
MPSSSVPKASGNFIFWYAEALNHARNRLGVTVHILAVVFAEPWPCSWGVAMRFWGSKIMRSDHVLSLIHISEPTRLALI